MQEEDVWTFQKRLDQIAEPINEETLPGSSLPPLPPPLAQAVKEAKAKGGFAAAFMKVWANVFKW